MLIARERRQRALNRTELRYASEPRAPAQGSTSFPVKVIDPEVQRMIDEALAKKRGV